ncbi:MAG: NUDIX domain-containing protein [Ignavibacteriae bacterium]|nr:NUDIX domain-containing protein [Ignavibacteriota bacterium]
MKPEVIDIFNERMELIGTAPRKEAHKVGNWHKVFHCWVLTKDADGNEYVVFQLRSKEKDTVPNSLDISAAGHLHSGETPAQGLRELKEELGIKATEDNLKFLGVHVEVWCDEKTINREFDYVYFLRNDLELHSYKVQPSEVIGLTKIKIEDGISLFTKEKNEITALSIHYDEKGKAVNHGFNQKLEISSFAGGERNNYFIKIFVLAKQYFEGKTLLYI